MAACRDLPQPLQTTRTEATVGRTDRTVERECCICTDDQVCGTCSGHLPLEATDDCVTDANSLACPAIWGGVTAPGQSNKRERRTPSDEHAI